MSSKFKKQQKKKRWSECGVSPPPWFTLKIDTLASSCSSVELQSFLDNMQRFLSLRSTYAELQALAELCAFVVAFAEDNKDQPANPSQEDDLHIMLSMLAELLFMENSRPLHRQLLSQLRSLPEKHSALLGRIICGRVAQLATAHLPPGWHSMHSVGTTWTGRHHTDQAGLQAGAIPAPNVGVSLRDGPFQASMRAEKEAPPGVQGVPLGQALTSLLSFPSIRACLAPCAAPAVACVSLSISFVLSGVTAGPAIRLGGAAGGEDGWQEASLHIPPSVMEDVQDAVSALYYMLTGFGQQLAESAEGRSALLLAADALLVALKGSVLAREALASAAVALYAATTLPAATPQSVALHFAEGLLRPPPQTIHPSSEGGHAEDAERNRPTATRLVAAAGGPTALEGPLLGLVDTQLRDEGSSLVHQLQGLPDIARVCALKGLLYAMPLEVCCAPLLLEQASGTSQPGGTNGSCTTPPAPQPWMLLTDGAIGVLCAAIQVAPDSHFKFHAVRALAVCLDRIKESLESAGEIQGDPPQPLEQSVAELGLNPSSGEGGTAQQAQQGGAPEGLLSPLRQGAGPPHVPALIRPALRDELKHILWGAWEDPLGQTVKQVHAAFSTLLDIMDLQARMSEAMPGDSMGRGGSAVGVTSAPAQPPQAVAGGKDDFLKGCAMELVTMDPVRKARYAPLSVVIPRVGAGAILGLQPDLVDQSLAAMEDHVICSSVGGMLSVLWETLRSECLACAGGDQPAASRAWAGHWAPPMLRMLCSSNQTLRHNVAVYALPALLQLGPSVMVHLLQHLLHELRRPGGDSGEAAAACVAILKAGRSLQQVTDLQAIPVEGLDEACMESILQQTVVHESENIRVDTLQLVCVHPKTTSLPTPLELRIAAKFISLTLRCPVTSLRNKFISLIGKLLVRIRVGAAAVLNKPAHQQTKEMLEGVAQQQEWLQWFSRTLMASLYPGAPFARTFMAVELINTLLDTFGDLVVPGFVPALFRNGCEARFTHRSFSTFCEGFVSKQLVDLLLVASVDTWDKLREGANRALMLLPTPLPGLAEKQEVQDILEHAFELVNSPRLGESDAGAKLVLLVFKKYVASLGWVVALSTSNLAPDGLPVCATISKEAPEAGLDQPRGQLQVNLAVLCFLEGACGLLEARIRCAQRDMVVACKSSLAHGALITLRYLLAEVAWMPLLEVDNRAEKLISRILALVYEASALVMGPLSRPQEQNMGAGDVDADDVDLASTNLEGAESADAPSSGATTLGPTPQVILTGCWLTSKECSLLLGTMARTLPLAEGRNALMSAEDLHAMGAHFVQVLCMMKHNGALEKAQAGFVALSERLLKESSPSLNTLPQQWLTALLNFMRRPGQGRSDIVRRSAGLPFAINALFTAEPGNTHKILMARGMDALLHLATGTTGEEPWPRVHALNVLRVAFNDANLACDTSAYYARGVEVSMLAMAATQWEVRNAATLCYTSLMVRILGFRNTATRDAAAKRAMTGADFFTQYPSLHPFLLCQLAAATEHLEHGGGRVMHPSLFPVLALLSRLRPSPHSHLSPAAFAPLVRRCAAADPYAVRQLAAQALPPLLPPTEAPAAMVELAADVARCICGPGLATDGHSAPANAVHGWMLQLRLLLESAAGRGGEGAGTLTAGLADVAGQLRRCVGVCDLRRYSCAPLSLEYLKTVSALALLSQHVEHVELPAQQVLHQLFADVAHYCWVSITEDHVEPEQDSGNPMVSVALKTAAALYFRHLRGFHGQGTTLEAAMRCALGSRRYEVRCAALKELSRLLTSQQEAQRGAALDAVAIPALRDELCRHLATERHHKAVKRTLCLLSLLSSAQPLIPVGTRLQDDGSAGVAGGCAAPWGTMLERRGSTAGDCVLTNQLLARAQSEADPAIRHYAVQCLSQQVQAVLAAAATTGLETQRAQQVLRSFTAVLHDCSQPWQLPELRWAAVEALRAARILGLAAVPPPSPGAVAAQATSSASPAPLPTTAGSDTPQPWLVEAGVKGWEVAVRLLEEEDADIRAAMAALAATVVLADQPPGLSQAVARLAPIPPVLPVRGIHSVHSSSGGGSGPGQIGMNVTVEWVERAVFAWLPGHVGCHPALVAQLCDWVYRRPVPPPGEGGGEGLDGGVGHEGGQAEERRLFDKELDNHHEEPLLIAQLAATALGSLVPAVEPRGQQAEELRMWALSAVTQLELAVRHLTLRVGTGANGVGHQGAGRMLWMQYGEVSGAVQDGIVSLYRMLLAALVAAEAPAMEKFRATIASRLGQLFVGVQPPGKVLLEQPHLCSLTERVMEAWGCQLPAGTQLKLDPAFLE